MLDILKTMEAKIFLDKKYRKIRGLLGMPTQIKKKTILLKL